MTYLRSSSRRIPRFSPALIAAAALVAIAGCSTVPATNGALEAARSDYRSAQDDPATRDLAPVELKQAGTALALADAAWSRHDGDASVDHLAYLARTRVAIAQETGHRRSAEQELAGAATTRDQLRLAARTGEADAAQRSAMMSRQQAEASQMQARASQIQARSAERDAHHAQREAEDAQRQAVASQQQTSEMQAHASELEAQLQALNARKTDRGMVVTIGDLLFDTNRAQLKAGGMRNIERLGGFLKEYPHRRARIEGFTDSTGSDERNQTLSTARADAVRTALVGMGVDSDRLATQGYGESYPVAGNDSAGGRQSNRRVEVILSDDDGTIAPR